MDGTQESCALAGLGEFFGGFAPSALHWAFEYMHRWCAKQYSQSLMRGSVPLDDRIPTAIGLQFTSDFFFRFGFVVQTKNFSADQ
jgi:hypothetical protein